MEFVRFTFEELAEIVANEFRKDMEEQGFETFEEMKRCYDWEWSEIKDEVDFILSDLARTTFKETGKYADVMMSDDQTTIYNHFDEMSWREFKKLWMTRI